MALGADTPIARDRTILIELSIAEQDCWYPPSLARHRLNLRERCYQLPRRMSYFGNGNSAESKASKEDVD
jgi:hypothetical protein